MDGSVAGSAADVLLWLWGRDADVVMEGMPDAVETLRAAMCAVTQG